MVVVPILDVPNQSFNVLLDNQFCEFNIYQKSTGLFGDLRVNNELIVGGRIWQDRNRFIRSSYTLFKGDFAFVDMHGSSDPSYPGLGSRFILVYYEASEL